MLQLVVQLLITHSAPNAVNNIELAQAIISEATSAGVDPLLVTRILLTESNGVAHAVNEATGDVGIMQINAIHGVEEECLLDWRCNLRVGVQILAKFKQHRPCAYNVGYRYKTRISACLAYEAKLEAL